MLANITDEDDNWLIHISWSLLGQILFPLTKYLGVYPRNVVRPGGTYVFDPPYAGCDER